MKHHSGFTLLEIMMVIAVMGTLFTLGHVSISKLIKNRSAHNAISLARQADAALVNYRTSTSRSQRSSGYGAAIDDADRYSFLQGFWDDAPSSFTELNQLADPWEIDLPNSSDGVVSIGKDGVFESFENVKKIGDLPGF